MPAMVSALSAMASTAPSDGRRHGVVHRLGLIVVIDGVADGFGSRVRQNADRDPAPWRRVRR